MLFGTNVPNAPLSTLFAAFYVWQGALIIDLMQAIADATLYSVGID